MSCEESSAAAVGSRLQGTSRTFACGAMVYIDSWLDFLTQAKDLYIQRPAEVTECAAPPPLARQQHTHRCSVLPSAFGRVPLLPSPDPLQHQVPACRRRDRPQSDRRPHSQTALPTRHTVAACPPKDRFSSTARRRQPLPASPPHSPYPLPSPPCCQRVAFAIPLSSAERPPLRG